MLLGGAAETGQPLMETSHLLFCGWPSFCQSCLPAFSDLPGGPRPSSSLVPGSEAGLQPQRAGLGVGEHVLGACWVC